MYVMDGARGVIGAQLLCQLAQEKGLPLTAILEGTEVSFSQLGDAQTTISHQQELLIFKNVIHALEDTAGFGVQLASRYRLGNYGVFGFGLMSAETVSEALLFGVKNIELTFSLARVFPMHGEHAIRLYFVADFLPTNDAVKIAVLERDIAAVITVFNEALEEPLRCNAVHFTHADNGGAAVAAEHFGVMPQYNSASSYIEITNDWLSRALPRTNLATHQACKVECDALLKKRYADYYWSYRAKQHLRNASSLCISMEGVAKKLGVSSRTLRRYLQAEGVTFRQLAEKVRKNRAQDMLVYTQITIEEVSALVGYEETASFVRAFRRWTGTTPGRWRREQQANRAATN